jgi:hypothetical protein
MHSPDPNARPLSAPTGRVTDFDFLHGNWTVQHRRLRQRWANSADWDEFASTSRCEPRLGGVANIEQIDCPERGFAGMTVRLFDLATSRWSIYWANSTVGRLEPPVLGGFTGDVGTFVGPDVDGDAPIDVQFTWTVIDDAHARWEQAFTRSDHGTETNWVMEFTRR